MIVDKAAFEQMIEHLTECARDAHEGVGLLSATLDGQPRHTGGQGLAMITNVAVDRWTALANVSDYPRLRYEVDPAELIWAYEALEADGYRPAIMVHSHVTGGTLPSPTDIRYATNPALLHMIVDMAGSRPAVKLWQISPSAEGAQQVQAVRLAVADLRKQENPPTDLTHGVTGD